MERNPLPIQQINEEQRTGRTALTSSSLARRGREGGMDGWMEALGGRREERKTAERKKKVTSPANPGTSVGHNEMALEDTRATPCVALCSDVSACVLASRYTTNTGGFNLSCWLMSGVGICRARRPERSSPNCREIPADAYLAFFFFFFSSWSSHLIPESIRPSFNTPKRAPSLPMLPHNVSVYISLSRPFFFFFSSFCFYLDRKTPEVFLVGNSRRGMLLREQGARVESRFSGSSLTPRSAIPSRGLVSRSDSCRGLQRC